MVLKPDRVLILNKLIKSTFICHASVACPQGLLIRETQQMELGFEVYIEALSTTPGFSGYRSFWQKINSIQAILSYHPLL